MADNSEKNTQNSIPVSKVERAARFVKTGVKVGANYVKHYAQKMVNPDISQEDLDKANAEDIYNTLSELKGSALKMAQMMSMHEGIMPNAYNQKFQAAQYSAPPLSAPLVVKTFQNYFGKSPYQLFDSFDKEASNAASIGQVHKATKDGMNLAVKIQYPGVAESVRSDLKMVRPFAVQLLNINEKEIDLFVKEVEEMLVAETDYTQELRNGQAITNACVHIPNLRFPKYFPEFSSERIITMEWLDGIHLEEFMQTNPSEEVRNAIGQTMWDFYDFQIHHLQEVHADPHPGNFLFRPDGTMGVIDFGCVKRIPQEYYFKHFQVINPATLQDRQEMERVFMTLDFLRPEDTPEERKLFGDIFRDMIEITTRPLRYEVFNFGDDSYYEEMYALSDRMASMEELRKSKHARGSQHSLYLNRAYFGLYFILNKLKVKIRPQCYWFTKNNINPHFEYKPI